MQCIKYRPFCADARVIATATIRTSPLLLIRQGSEDYTLFISGTLGPMWLSQAVAKITHRAYKTAKTPFERMYSHPSSELAARGFCLDLISPPGFKRVGHLSEWKAKESYMSCGHPDALLNYPSINF